MKNLLFIIFICIFLLSCQKELAKDGDIYLGYIHFRYMPTENVDGEFRVAYAKSIHTIYFEKSSDKNSDKRIELNYDKKTKEFVGSFYFNNFPGLYYYSGKKVNGDFIITLFYVGLGSNSPKNSPPISAKKMGEIYLTPKQN